MGSISERDRSILRRLAEQQAAIAGLAVHRGTAENWKRLNRLERVKPLVLIWPSQVPWHELNVDDELTLQTGDGFCRGIEQRLRRTLYMWKHLRGDMVVEREFHCPFVVRDTGFGIAVKEETAQTDAANEVVAHRYEPQIRNEADVEKIETPRVAHDAEATEENYQRLVDLFGDILTIEKRGATGWNASPVDELFTWWGIQEAMIDLVLRPELFHQAMERLTGAHLARLAQYEALNLFSPGNGNVITGQGGLAFTDELPQPNSGSARVRPMDLWGSAQAQIFGSVSPEMHEEFALRYERRVLERFGLNYYGCCEPLDGKLHVLKSVPRLRKLSMSPWVDVDRAVQALGDRFVFSRKPNPAIFAEEAWNPEGVRRELREFLQKARGCVIEIILKDVSTVRYHPRRLWEWARIAAEVTEEFAC